MNHIQYGHFQAFRLWAPIGPPPPPAFGNEHREAVTLPEHLRRTRLPASAFITAVDQECTMEIVRLPIGEQAPVDADCIRIEELTGSTFKLTASALCVGSDDGDSVSIVDAPVFESVEQAEAAGTAWATNVGVERLFVSRGTLEQPLEVMEIDKPL